MFLRFIKSDVNISDINIENAKAVGGWIKKKYPESAVYITGSVLKPNLIHPGSDIDIVVDEIEEGDFEVLIKDVHHEFPDLRIDLRRMKELDSYIRQKIINSGYRVRDDEI